MNRFQNVDFERLYKVLSLRAMDSALLRRTGHVDVGFDYKDVLGEVFKDFFESPEGLGWKESKGPIEPYLGKILPNKIIDHLRRQKHVASSLDDDHKRAAAINDKKGVFGRAPERAKIDTKSKLYELVGDDPPLRDLIAAAELTSGDHNVNQELGDTLDKSPHQVSKLKDRLLKKGGVRELYDARQAARSRT